MARRRPSPAQLGDRWFTSEQSTAAGMIGELQRVRRRAARRPVAVIALAALIGGALVAMIVHKHREVEAQITLALTEGTLTGDRSGVHKHELLEYVGSVLLSDKNLAEVIEREDLIPLRRKLGMPYAVTELREQLEIEVWKNTFLYYRESESNSRKSARIGITVLDANPERAFDTARALAAVMIRTHDEERARINGAIAEEVTMMREGLEAQLAELDGMISAQRAAITSARAKGKAGVAAALEVELRQLTRRHKGLAEQRSQIALSRDALADRISAAGLDITLSIVDERRPDRPELTTFGLVLACCVAATVALFGSAMIVSTFDSRVDTADDVTRLGVPVLGHLPAFAGDRLGSLKARGLRSPRGRT